MLAAEQDSVEFAALVVALAEAVAAAVAEVGCSYLDKHFESAAAAELAHMGNCSAKSVDSLDSDN